MNAFVRAHSYSPLAIPVCGGSYRLKSYSDVMVFIVNKANPIAQILAGKLMLETPVLNDESVLYSRM